jgi:protein-arginine kinase activator protein McsA
MCKPDDQLTGVLLCDECEDMPALFHMEIIIGDEEQSNGSDLKDRLVCDACCNDILEENPNAYEWALIEEQETAQAMDLIASGYDWICLTCQKANHEIESRMEVICPQCQTHFATNPPEHCYE